MNITYSQSLDEECFRTVAQDIYKTVQKYYIQVTKSKYHPQNLTYSEWRLILSEILGGFWILLQKKENLPKNRIKVDRSLFLLCRYFYDLRN